jgi:hypothetical protein
MVKKREFIMEFWRDHDGGVPGEDFQIWSVKATSIIDALRAVARDKDLPRDISYLEVYTDDDEAEVYVCARKVGGER